jgi:hypothetical protein
MGAALPTQPAGNNPYCIHPDHRNGNPNKSQWTITEEEERAAFVRAVEHEWLLQNRGWGLHLHQEQPQYLGTSKGQAAALFVAKFVSSGAQVSWHGYPADHQRNIQDIPESKVLKSWIDLRLLALPKIRKLMKGQPCSL